MKRVGPSSVILLAILCAICSAVPQDANPSEGVEPSVTLAEPPNASGTASGDGTHKRSALLNSFPSSRQSTQSEYPGQYRPDQYRPDQYRPDQYRSGQPRPDQYRSGFRVGEQHTQSHVPLVRSFQAASYVHDDVPSMIFGNKRAEDADLPPFLTGQTATQTERSSVIVPLYFDEHDEHLGLTDIEERVKIFYNGNPDLLPPLQDWKKLQEAKKKQNRLFNYFKTQRANFVI